MIINKLKNKKNNNNEKIKCFDSYGREMLITKDDWIKKILPGQIKKEWNNLQGLYNVIYQAFNDEIYHEVLKSCLQLVSIDDNFERSTTMLGICYHKLNKLRKSKSLYEDYIKKYGETGNILVNYAKILYELNQNDEGFEILKKALYLDPNLDNGLLWWASIHNEKGGNNLYIESLKEISKIENSWRPQLWLARYHLEQNNLQSAMDYYLNVPEFIFNDGSLLMMISGDLGKNGYIDEIIDFVLPKYKPELHGYDTANNLLNAYLNLERFNEGFKLIQLLQDQKWPHIKDSLLFYEKKFEELKIKESNSNKESISKNEIIATVLNKPIWYYGLNSPPWIKPIEEKINKNIYLIPFSAKTETSSEELQTEDFSGILSRSIPLFLLENIFVNSIFNSDIVVLVKENAGPILFGKEVDMEYLKNIQDKSEKFIDYFVTGYIENQNNNYELSISLYDMTLNKKLNIITKYKLTESNFNKCMEEIIIKTNSLIEELNMKVPHNDFQYDSYLRSVNNCLLFTLIQNKYIPYSSIWGEISIFDNMINLILNNKTQINPKIQLVSSLVKASKFGSKNLENIKVKIYQMITDGIFNEDSCLPLLKIIYSIYKDEENQTQLNDLIGSENMDWFEEFNKDIK